MDAQIETGEAAVSKEPIGEVVLGNVDPRTLSHEQFQQSPDLPFHGASKEFVFIRDHDYSNFEAPHSHTVGKGFYTTDSREQAQLFSEAFGRKEDPIVVELLPYHARMFDFRRKDNEGYNAPVPIDMFQGYKKYIAEYFDNYFKDYDVVKEVEYINNTPVFTDESSESGPSKSFNKERQERVSRLMFWNHAQEYRRVLTRLSNKESIDLRQMLSIQGSSSTSEFASSYFSDFMRTEGFDGIIYIEGGDHPLQREKGSGYENPHSYVFFNLKKIGTYDAWNS